MPYRDWRLRIDDMLEAIDKIERYTKDMDLRRGSTMKKPLVRSFVIWRLLGKRLLTCRMTFWNVIAKSPGHL